MIPDNYLKKFCNAKGILGCDYFIDLQCPNTCSFASRINQGISHTSKSGLERFKERYPEWLGIGAMVLSEGEIIGGSADFSTKTK